MAHQLLQSEDLVRVLAGDATYLVAIEGYTQSEIAGVAGGMSTEHLSITPAAVKRVLLDLLQKKILPEQAQRWASFVKRGYIETKETPIQPIATHYPPDREDEIVDALSRLDELGDVVDGTIDDQELRSLITRLSS